MMTKAKKPEVIGTSGCLKSAEILRARTGIGRFVPSWMAMVKKPEVMKTCGCLIPVASRVDGARAYNTKAPVEGERSRRRSTLGCASRIRALIGRARPRVRPYQGVPRLSLAPVPGHTSRNTGFPWCITK
jgi:hypothetical protein